MDKRKEIQNVMIKPLHDCDMHCDYCFVSTLTKQYKKQRMDMNTLNKVFKVLSNSAKKVNIIWHGGEPTMMGVQWYKDMLELSYIYSEKTEFTHSMQSNGLTLTEEWADLMENYGIGISVSYDGIFQEYRKAGTAEIVENNILKFREYQNKRYAGALSVVTENSYKGMIENYEYLKNKGIHVTYNYGINPNPENTEEYTPITANEFVKHFMKFFKHWMEDVDGYEERSCITVLRHVMGMGTSTCSNSDCRYEWVNVNPDGTTTPCNRYFPEELRMGNIKYVNNVQDLYNTEPYKEFCNMSQFRIDNDCKDCEVFEYCNGGCNSMHMMNTGEISKADKTYCDRFKLEFKEVYKLIRNLRIDDIKFNKHFNNIFYEGVFPTLEIINFLKTKEECINKIKFDDNNLHECTEFKIFRLFNPIRSKGYVGHVDKLINSEGEYIKYENNINRNILLNNIYERHVDEIQKILGE